MPTRLANKILFKGCINPEGEQVARRMQSCVRDAEILVNADEPVRRFFELDTDGSHGWAAGAHLPNVCAPASIQTLFIESRMPTELPDGWQDLLGAFGLDFWGASLSYQDLVSYYAENTDVDDPREAAHGRAEEALASHLCGRGGPQGEPSVSLEPYDTDRPAPRWLLESEMFLDLSSRKSVLGGAYGMDAVVLEDGSFAEVADGTRAIYYRTSPQAFEADVEADPAELAAAAGAGVAALYVPLLATLCLTHHRDAPPLSYLAGIAPSGGKSKAGISSSNNWRTFETSAVEEALQSEGGLYPGGLRSALAACAQRFQFPPTAREELDGQH